jgi:hypothetical protein
MQLEFNFFSRVRVQQRLVHFTNPGASSNGGCAVCTAETAVVRFTAKTVLLDVRGYSCQAQLGLHVCWTAERALRTVQQLGATLIKGRLMRHHPSCSPANCCGRLVCTLCQLPPVDPSHWLVGWLVVGGIDLGLSWGTCLPPFLESVRVQT